MIRFHLLWIKSLSGINSILKYFYLKQSRSSGSFSRSQHWFPSEKYEASWFSFSTGILEFIRGEKGNLLPPLSVNRSKKIWTVWRLLVILHMWCIHSLIHRILVSYSFLSGEIKEEKNIIKKEVILMFNCNCWPWGCFTFFMRTSPAVNVLFKDGLDLLKSETSVIEVIS